MNPPSPKLVALARCCPSLAQLAILGPRFCHTFLLASKSGESRSQPSALTAPKKAESQGEVKPQT